MHAFYGREQWEEMQRSNRDEIFQFKEDKA
jgi:hypothetical protein